MKGPIRMVRSGRIAGFGNLGSLYGWQEGRAYLMIDEVEFKGKRGAVLCYFNPPVHQVGNPGLDAYLAGLKEVFGKSDQLAFLVLYGANDPVHAGGDLKESLTNLDRTLALKGEKERTGAGGEEIDRLYDWADNRLRKGFALRTDIRRLAQAMRVIAVCGGGTRFGGSAEIPLMADFLVGDSRSGMCFSEATIGLIPGWSGIARALVKSGLTNARYMGLTCREVKGEQLQEIGIYNDVVPVPFPFPRRQKTDNPEADKTAYQGALERHDDDTGALLLSKAMELAVCPEQNIPKLQGKDRKTLTSEAEISREVDRRKNPDHYAHLWGKPLKAVQAEIAEMGRPLAPQSVEALTRLLDRYDPSSFDETSFAQWEMEADARLYRDRRFRAGLIATLEQCVADYR